MNHSRRTVASIGVLLCLAVVASIVFFAVQADGREGTESTTNDGGAWLVNRRAGSIGHVNHEVQELSAAVRVSQPGARVEVLQPEGVVVAHDMTSDALEVFDERTHLRVNTVDLPDGARVQHFRGGVVISAEDPFRVWRIPASQLGELAGLASLDPIFEGDRPGVWAVAIDGDVAIDDIGNARLVLIGRDEVVSAWPRSSVVESIVFNGSQVVVRVGDRVATIDGDALRFVGDGVDPWIVHQQPTQRQLNSFVAATESGSVVKISMSDGSVEQIGKLPGASPAPLINHNGCVHAVTNEPAAYWVRCGVAEPLVSALDASQDGELKLRLVNGWVWINDLATGRMWLVNDDLELSRIDDWGAVLPQNSDPDDLELSSAQTADDVIEEVENPDAEDASTVDADEFDEDGVNQPPVAFDDDEVQTQLGRPVVIAVVTNDEDPDNDVLLISSAQNLVTGSDAGGVVQPTIDGTSVQVSPAADFVGVIRYSYTITDGRGGSDTAVGSVNVRARTGDDNQAPVAVTDVGSVAAGEKLIINVISNDYDPDGDSLVLVAASAPQGTITFDPSGQIIFEPETISAEGEIELSYTISDDFGELTDGRVRANIRLRDSNQPPDARNDGGITVVAQPITINLLLNDTDPDGDDLFVAQRPTLLSPADTEVFTTITPDGEFVFIPEAAGTYVFSYGASDEEDTDLAQIRVDVTEPTSNQPPIAVRDDVVIPAGESRIVYVLANDGDPDGDVVGIVDFIVTPGSGLRVERFNEIGFRVFADAQGPSRRTFRYAISDGQSDSSETTVVVAVADAATTNQPPVAEADTAEIRPGASQLVQVLTNDFDPEGGSLRVVGVSAADGGTAEVGAGGQGVRVRVDSTTSSSFTLTYDVIDESNNRSSATVRVRVVPPSQANRPPVARPDSAWTAFETELAINVVSNDSDPDGDAIRVESVTSQPINGTAEVDPLSGEIIYTPAANFAGGDRFSYTIVDAFGAQAQGEVQIGVMAELRANRDPVALDDSFIAIALGGSTDLDVLINDADPDGDQLRVESVESTTVGTVTRTLDGRRLVFDAPVQLAEDQVVTFEYRVSDGSGGRASAEVTVLVQATPLQTAGSPSAVDDDAGTAATGDEVRVEVVTNDFDPDTPLSELVVAVLDPDARVEGQTVVLVAGDDDVEVTYQITDPQGNESSATISLVVVNPVPPVAVDDTLGPVSRGDVVDVPVLENDFDVDGEPGSLELVEVSGEDAAIGDGFVRITAPAESAQYTYRIQDADGLVSSATISLIVTDNRAPIVDSPAAATEFETPVQIDLSSSGTDPDSDPLLYSCCISTRNGSPEVLDAGEGVLLVEFTPDDGFSGEAVFTYEVNDRFGHVVAASVAVTVGEQPNRPPTAIDGTVEIQAPRLDGPSVSETVDLASLSDDPDEDDVLTWSIDADPAANLSASLEGSVLRIEATDSVDPGATSLTWSVTDPEGESSSSTIEITVTEPLNNPPTAADTTVTLAAGTDTIYDLASGVVDDDPNEILTYEIGSNTSSQITATRTGDARVTVAAAVNASGATDSFTYTVTDRMGEAVTATIAIEVGDPDQDPPTAVDDTAATIQGVAVDVAVLVNDVDPLGQNLTIVDPGTSSDGTVTLSGNVITLRPAASFFGEATFAYTIRDAADIATRESTGTVRVAVTGRPNKPAAPTCERGSKLVNLVWTAPNGNGDAASDYRVETDVAGTTPQPPLGNTTSHEWTGLQNAVSYRFRVAASNIAGESEPSEWSVPCTPDIAPEVPAAPTVTHDDGELVVTWAEPNNEGSSIDSYELRIGGGAPIPIVDRLSHTWEGLENGQSYTFEVAAVNAAGSSGFSPLSVPAYPSTTPDAPVIGVTTRPGLIGAANSGILEMHWTPVPIANDGGDRVEFYRVQSRPVGSTTLANDTVNGPNANFHRWVGLSDGVAHEFRVRAVNRDGDGDWSGWSGAVEPCTVPPNPTITSVTPGDKNATVVVAEGLGGAGTECAESSFNIRVAGTTGPGRTITAPGTVLMTGLENAQSYAFEARANNIAGPSNWVTSAAVVPLGLPICGGNYRVNNIDQEGQELMWNDANFNGGTTQTYERRENGGAWRDNGTDGHNVLFLAADQTHTVELRAVNEVGATFCDTVVYTTCPDLPPAPNKPASSVNGATRVIRIVAPPAVTVACTSQPFVDASAYAMANHQINPDSTAFPQGQTDARQPGSPQDYGPLNVGTTLRARAQACYAATGVCGAWSPWSNTQTVPAPTITVVQGRRASNPAEPSCTPWCDRVDITFANFAPNQSVPITLSTSAATWCGYTVQMDGNGSAFLARCWSNEYGDSHVVTGGGVVSNSVVFVF